MSPDHSRGGNINITPESPLNISRLISEKLFLIPVALILYRLEMFQCDKDAPVQGHCIREKKFSQK